MSLLKTTPKLSQNVRDMVKAKLAGDEFVNNNMLFEALQTFRKKRVQEIYGVKVTKDMYGLIEECIHERKEIVPKRSALNFGKRRTEGLFEASGAWWHQSGCQCEDDDCVNGFIGTARVNIPTWAHGEDCMCSECMRNRGILIILTVVFVVGHAVLFGIPDAA